MLQDRIRLTEQVKLSQPNMGTVTLHTIVLEALFSAVIQRMNADKVNTDIRDIPETPSIMDE